MYDVVLQKISDLTEIAEQTLSKEALKTIFEEENSKQERFYLDFNKLESYFPKRLHNETM